MPIKYFCPKCSKRFVDWGAEKLNFKCPVCIEEDLLRVGGSDELHTPSKKPSLKRKTKAKKAAKKAAKKKKVPTVTSKVETVDLDVSGVEGEKEFEIEDSLLTVPDGDDTTDLDDELSADLAFGTVAPPLGEKPDVSKK